MAKLALYHIYIITLYSVGISTIGAAIVKLTGLHYCSMAAGWFKGSGEDDVDELNTAINEQSGEERRLAARFQKAMNEFATERSLETCLDALNLSIQLANIRAKTAKSWEHYARMMEGEVTRLSRPEKK